MNYQANRDCLCDECEFLINNSMLLHLAIGSNLHLYGSTFLAVF